MDGELFESFKSDPLTVLEDMKREQEYPSCEETLWNAMINQHIVELMFINQAIFTPHDVTASKTIYLTLQP